MPPSTPDRSDPPATAADLAGVGRLEAMTLRCDRASRRRIETAWKQARSKRADLSLGRFLAERITDNLVGNGPGNASQSSTDAPVDLDQISEIVAIASMHAVSQAMANEMAPMGVRLAAIERTLGAMTGVIHDMALRIAAHPKP